MVDGQHKNYSLKCLDNYRDISAKTFKNNRLQNHSFNKKQLCVFKCVYRHKLMLHHENNNIYIKYFYFNF